MVLKSSFYTSILWTKLFCALYYVQFNVSWKIHIKYPKMFYDHDLESLVLLRIFSIYKKSLEKNLCLPIMVTMGSKPSSKDWRCEGAISKMFGNRTIRIASYLQAPNHIYIKVVSCIDFTIEHWSCNLSKVTSPWKKVRFKTLFQ